MNVNVSIKVMGMKIKQQKIYDYYLYAVAHEIT